MRNVFLFGLVVFIVVASGGYAITWYAQASAIKDAIEDGITRINEKQKYISFESIETSGFPSKVQVAIVKPRFQGRLDPFFKAVSTQAGQPAAGNAADGPQWNEDILLDGKIVLGINAMSNHYSMTVSGNWHETSTIGDQKFTHITQQASDVTCLLQFERSTGIFDTLWDFQQLHRDGEALMKDFRALDCNTMGQTTADAQTKEVISSSGPVRLYITSAPMSAIQQVRFYLKITDMEVTKVGDGRMTHYMRAISPGQPATYALSSYGKQNVDIDFTYHGPIDIKPEDKNPPIDITLNKFDIRNQIYTYSLGFRLNNTPKDKDRTLVAYLKSEATFSEQYDAMLHEVTRGIIQQIYTSNDPKFKEMQAALQKYTQEQTYAIVYPVIPKLHPLGKIVAAFDAGFSGSENFTVGNYTLDAFEISMAPYAITAKGSAQAAPGTMPGGNLHVICRNCLSIIDDVYDYALRLQKMMHYFAPHDAAAMNINMEQAQAYKKFLSLLAVEGKDDAGASVLIFDIVGSGPNMTINGKNMNQIAVLYNEYVRPFHKKPK